MSSKSSVAIYSCQESTVNQLQTICDEWGVELFIANNSKEFLSQKFTMAFIEKDLFSRTLAEDLVLLLKDKSPANYKIIVFGGRPPYISFPLDMFCIVVFQISHSEIIKILANYCVKKPKIKKDILKSRIHRVVYLVDLLRGEDKLYVKHLCDSFGISERTFFRDIKLIKEVFPDLYIEYDRKE